MATKQIETVEGATAVTRFPARIERAVTLDPAYLTQLLRERDLQFDADNLPYFFPAEISSTRRDSYFTHMSTRTLDNFAADAREGRALLDSHDAGKLGMGYSLDGRVEQVIDQATDAPLLRAAATFYTARGIAFGGKHSYRSTDDFIRAMETGLVRDVSVGFHGGTWVCDVCGNDWTDYEACKHWPGEVYEVDGERILCTVEIDNARLSEVSAVYDGATPGAMILKADRMADAGLLTPAKARILEQRYNLHLPQVYRTWPTAVPVPSATETRESTNGITLQVNGSITADQERHVLEHFRDVANTSSITTDNTGAWIYRDSSAVNWGEWRTPTSEEIVMQKKENREQEAEVVADAAETVVTEVVEETTDEPADALQEIQAALDAAQAALDAMTARAETAEQALATAHAAVPDDAPEEYTLAQVLRWQAGEVSRLRPLADDGRRYREDLITEALAEGVRALGEAFSRETYEAVLRAAGIDTIRRMRDDWKQIGDQRFPGGRKIQEAEVDETPQPEVVTDEVPRHAFKA